MDPVSVNALIMQTRTELTAELPQAFETKLTTDPAALTAGIEGEIKTRDVTISTMDREIKNLTAQLTQAKADHAMLDGKVQASATRGPQKKPLGEGTQEDAFKLQDNCTKEQFRHWAECLEIQIERAEGWSNWSAVLRAMKLSKEEVDHTSLVKIITDLNANDDVYALIVHGDGEKFFSAGADLNNFSDGDKGRAISMAIAFGEAFEALSAYRGVSIAVINGYAMGGGLECALACDIRIAEAHAQMALPETGVGLLPCAGGTQNLPWLVGEGWAKRMILCGERVDADTALRIGLVEEVTAKGGGLQAAQDLAKKVAKQSPVAVSYSKALIQAARDTPPAQNLIHEREAFVKLFDTMDQREGVQAFLEKRQPNWQNK